MGTHYCNPVHGAESDVLFITAVQIIWQWASELCGSSMRSIGFVVPFEQTHGTHWSISWFGHFNENEPGFTVGLLVVERSWRAVGATLITCFLGHLVFAALYGSSLITAFYVDVLLVLRRDNTTDSVC